MSVHFRCSESSFAVVIKFDHLFRRIKIGAYPVLINNAVYSIFRRDEELVDTRILALAVCYWLAAQEYTHEPFVPSCFIPHKSHVHTTSESLVLQ
jgi:hypothetical protein